MTLLSTIHSLRNLDQSIYQRYHHNLRLQNRVNHLA
jgi:hypothetical protein